MNSSLLKSILTAGLLFVSVSAFCQQSKTEDSLKKVIVNEVVISASRTIQNPNETGRGITVISRIEIEKSIYSNVGEILAKQPGIHFTGSEQTFGSSQRMFLRGSNSSHIVIMVDGVRISDPSSVDNGLNLSELSLSNVERIEIIRGPHSTLYGSSAIGGVVNIITRKNNTDKINSFSEIIAGKYGTKMGHTDLLLNHKKGFYLGLSANYQDVNGMDATIDTVTNPNTFKNRDNDGYKLFDYSVKTGFRNNKWDAFITYKNINQFSELDKSSFVDDDNRILEFSRNLTAWNLERTIGKFNHFSFQGGYSTMTRLDLDDSSVVDGMGNYDHQFSKSIFDGSYLFNELLFNRICNNYSLTIGTGINEEKMNNFNYVFFWSPFFGIYENTYDLDTLNLKSIVKSAFVHTELNGSLINKRLKDFNIAFGFRFTDHDRFGKNISYEINPSYKISTSSLLYLSYTTGFDAPSLYRLYSPDKGWGSVTTRGNPMLKPEKAVSFEVGLKQQIGDLTTFSFAFFSNRVKNVIEYVYLWDKNIEIDSLGTDWMRNDYRGDTYINLSEQIIKGIEFEIESKLSKNLVFSGNFTFLNAVSPINRSEIDTSVTKGNHVQLFESGTFITDRDFEKTALVRRPNAVVNIFVNWQAFKNLSVNLSSRFVGARLDSYYNPVLGPYGALDNELLGGYSFTNLSACYTFNKNFALTLKCENIFDSKYMEINGFSTRGRGFYLKLNYNFDRK